MARLLRVSLTDFRNYPHLAWAPGTRLNVLTGQNGSGKTNVLEAISLLTPGRGLRNARPDTLLRQGAETWAVASRVDGDGMVRELGTGTLGRDNPTGRNRVFRLDGAFVRSQDEIAAVVSIAWLTPQMERLFGEAATGRRRFLDRLVAGLHTGHSRAIAAHDVAVAGRNRLLLERRGETAWLRAAEDAIARHATTVTASRLAFCRRMNLAANSPADRAFPTARLDLLCPIADRLEVEPARLVEDWIRAELAVMRDVDARAAATGIGAHRCDLAILDHATSLPAQLASTGEQKALLVGIVLAHASLIEADHGDPPILLLDEPLVHLDEARRMALFDRLATLSSQVFLTGTDDGPFEPMSRDAIFWRTGADTVRAVGASA